MPVKGEEGVGFGEKKRKDAVEVVHLSRCGEVDDEPGRVVDASLVEVGHGGPREQGVY